MLRELARRMPTYRGEVAACHPRFPAGSSAACKETDVPVPIDAPDIAYSEADDEAIENFHRDNGVSFLSDHTLLNIFLSFRDGCSNCDLALGQFPNGLFILNFIDKRLNLAWDVCHETPRPRWGGRCASERIWGERPQGRRYVPIQDRLHLHFDLTVDALDLSICPTNVGNVRCTFCTACH